MITYSIQPKLPEGRINRIRAGISGAVNALLPSNKITRCEWTKIQYGVWIEAKKEKFKVGDLVCDIHSPPLANYVPWYYELKYIEELSKEVAFDTEMKEPLAFTVITQQNVYLKKCPGSLRHLTQEELDLVNLQNRPTQGNA